MLDFDGITEFWFGNLPEPKFPFEPINIGPIEFANPFEGLPEPEDMLTIESEE